MFGICGAQSVLSFSGQEQSTWKDEQECPATNRGFPADRRVGGGIDVDLVGRPSVESVATVSLGNDGHPGECTPVVAPPFWCGSSPDGGACDSYGAAGSVGRVLHWGFISRRMSSASRVS